MAQKSGIVECFLRAALVNRGQTREAWDFSGGNQVAKSESASASSGSRKSPEKSNSDRGGQKADVLVLGGGLSGALVALRFQTVKPGLTVTLLEKKERLAGDHTWIFHESDLPPGAVDSLRPLISKTWERWTVQFPKMEKTVEGRIHMVRSSDLHSYVMEKIGSSIHFGTEVERVTENSAELASGERYDAELVFDARGFAAPPKNELNGFNKYVSFDLQLAEPHGLSTPVLMDATCPQLDGFRFFTLLPQDDTTLTVQESYYSDSPVLNVDRLSRSIEAYCERKGWKIRAKTRQETCVLPMPLTSSYLSVSQPGEAIPIGARGGYFHATTTNSLPDAVKVAEFLAAVPEPNSTKVREAFARFRRPWASRQKFFRLLNRFLFYASEPSLRYCVLQNLFEQPTDVVSRYTGGRTSWGDRLRILSGRPNLPFDLTVKSLSERAVLTRGSADADA